MREELLIQSLPKGVSPITKPVRLAAIASRRPQAMHTRRRLGRKAWEERQFRSLV